MDEPKPSLDALRIERRERPAGGSRGPVGIVLLICLLAAAALAWKLVRTKGIEVRTVMARQVGSKSVEHTVLNASGYVTARRAATVSAKVTGKVTEVLIEEGLRVQPGQVLARLDDINVKASLQLAEAQLASAKAALEETRVRRREADQELERQSGLLKSKIAAQADYDHAEAAALAYKAKLEQQQADVIVAERTVASWQQQMEDMVIRAPFGGVVTTKDAQPGEMISPISAGGGFTRTGIGTIVDMESIEIEIDVNESYINRVQTGQPVEAALDAYPDWKIPCKVIAIIPTADRQKSTVKVRVGFDKLDPRILPDMSVKVEFREVENPGKAVRAGVVVPRIAIRQEQGRDIVMVVQNHLVERRPVSVVSSTGDEATIDAGVAGGERVVVDGPAGLTDGARVMEKTGETPGTK
jgi:HlyD family secretion protein